jgi:hypothetical protein
MGLRTLQMAAAVVVICVGLVLVVRRSPAGVSADPVEGSGFTRVGREGPVFTVSVPRARASDDEYLMKVAERLSSEEARAGSSGQVSDSATGQRSRSGTSARARLHASR